MLALPSPQARAMQASTTFEGLAQQYLGIPRTDLFQMIWRPVKTGIGCAGSTYRELSHGGKLWSVKCPSRPSSSDRKSTSPAKPIVALVILQKDGPSGLLCVGIGPRPKPLQVSRLSLSALFGTITQGSLVCCSVPETGMGSSESSVLMNTTPTAPACSACWAFTIHSTFPWRMKTIMPVTSFANGVLASGGCESAQAKDQQGRRTWVREQFLSHPVSPWAVGALTSAHTGSAAAQ